MMLKNEPDFEKLYAVIKTKIRVLNSVFFKISNPNVKIRNILTETQSEIVDKRVWWRMESEKCNIIWRSTRQREWRSEKQLHIRRDFQPNNRVSSRQSGHFCYRWQHR